MVTRTRLPNPELPGAMILAGGYKRCSTKEQVDGYGLDVQDDTLRAWEREAPNRKIVAMFADEGVSGELEIRPGMSELEEWARTRRINRIAVPKVDRIGRTARASYNWAWRMKDVGVHFIAIAERIDTADPLGWTMFQQYVFFSEMEWNRIRERTQAGREKKIQYGGWPGGPPPYGYRIEGKGQKGSFLVICEDEARVLLKAAELVINEGMNVSEAARELNRLGLFTRSGKPWTESNLITRMKSETIEGYTTYRKTNRGEGKNTTRLFEDGTPVYGEPVRLAVPCIFTPDRTLLLRESMLRTAFRRRRTKNRLYPLSGRVTGTTGDTYTGTRSAAGFFYQRPKGRGARLPAEAMEAATWGKVSQLLRNEDRLIAMTSEWLASIPGDREKYLARERDLAGGVTRQQQLISTQVPAYIKAGMDPVVAAAAAAKLKEELDGLETQLHEVRRWLAEHSQVRARAENIISLARETRRRLENPSLEVQTEIFEMFDVRVKADDLGFSRPEGVRCEVRAWHAETGTLIPPSVSDEDWERVLDLLKKRGLRTRSDTPDLRRQLEGCLHRLRHGLTWRDMPDTWGSPQRIRERQLSWWSKGLWPDMMQLLAPSGGVTVHQRPAIPRLHITGHLRRGLLVAMQEGGDGPAGEAVQPSLLRTGFETPVHEGVGLRFSEKTA